MIHASHVRMTGPLARFQDAIWTDLLGRGYAPLSAKNLLHVAAHLSRWMDAEGLSQQDLTRDRLQAFLGHRIDCGYRCWRTLRGLEPILVPLRDQGIIPFPEPVLFQNPAGAHGEEWRVGGGGQTVSNRWWLRFSGSTGPLSWEGRCATVPGQASVSWCKPELGATTSGMEVWDRVSWALAAAIPVNMGARNNGKAAGMAPRRSPLQH